MSVSVRVHLTPCLPGGGGFAAAGGADGGDDPSRGNYNQDRLDPDDDDDDEEEEEEESDDGESAAGSPLPSPLPPPHRGGKKNQKASATAELCRVCSRAFSSAKALHGHMRTHPQRPWRGVLPPSMRPGRELEVADSLILMSGKGGTAEKYPCKECGREFETRQALGGHRASHKKRDGCYARAAGRPPVQPPREEEDCTAESLGLVMGPSPSGNSAGASTSTNTVQEQELTSGATRRKRRRMGRRVLDLNQPPPPQSSDSNNGDGSGSGTASSSGAGDHRADHNKSSSI